MRYQRQTKRNKANPVLRLPFVQKVPRGLTNFWAFPKTAGYGPGTHLGRAAALAYLKAFKQSPAAGGHLPILVLSAIKEGVGPFGSDDGRAGIVVGFFAEVDRWLRLAVTFAGSHFDSLSDEVLLEQMNRAASTTSKEYDAQVEARIAAASDGSE
jgi:hypothetical protein